MWIVLGLVGLLVWGGVLLVVLSMCALSARADVAAHRDPAIADLRARVPQPASAPRAPVAAPSWPAGV
jgi:hypothetical protein